MEVVLCTQHEGGWSILVKLWPGFVKVTCCDSQTPRSGEWNTFTPSFASTLWDVESAVTPLPRREDPFIKAARFIKTIPTRWCWSAVTAVQEVHYCRQSYRLLSLVSSRRSGGYNRTSYGNQDSVMYYKPTVTWWITVLPGLICWRLGSPVIYTPKGCGPIRRWTE